jgi:sugar lactone lactonase YvrE
LTFTINPPLVTIGKLSPSTATVNGPGFTLAITGASFVSGATVMWGTTALATTFINSSTLTASVPASLLQSAATVSIEVINPNSQVSNSAPFTVFPVGNINNLITTIAGGTIPTTPVPASNASIGSVYKVAADSFGNVYFSALNGIFRVDKSGNMIRYGGHSGDASYSGDGGQATGAGLNEPLGMAADAAGNLFFADTGNNVVRKITPEGLITTVAGNGTCCFSGDGGPATSAQLNAPNAVALDAIGNLYIADANNNRIRKVTPNGVISTCAGTGTPGFSGDGGPANLAQLNGPLAVAFDQVGNLYIADMWNYRVRMVTPSGTISTFAGNGSYGSSGDGGPATSATLGYPQALAVDAAGNVYIDDWAWCNVREVGTNGTIKTVAGQGPNYPGDNGPATSAGLTYPSGVAVDPSGNLYIAEQYGYRLRIVTNGVITTFAGNGSNYFGDNGPATAAGVLAPQGTALDSAGNLYIADTSNNVVRKVTRLGVITTVAGNGTYGYAGDDGPATNAQFRSPTAVAFDSSGNLYIADGHNARIRVVTPGGAISTYAGTGSCCYSGDNGQATSAQLNWPTAIAFDQIGNLYIADGGNHTVRKVTPAGLITLVAGIGNSYGYNGDNILATSAQLNTPQGVAVDFSGNVYIGDSNNQRVRMVNTQGIISTFAGSGTCCTLGDGGAPTSAWLSNPQGLAIDSAGNLYIADFNNQRLRMVTTGGEILTVAGNGGLGYAGDGGPAQKAALASPAGVTVDASGNLYITQQNANFDFSTVRMIVPAGSKPILTAAMTHTGSLQAGESGATYSVVVSNVATAAPTTGTVTVTEFPGPGLTLQSMTGDGWSCSGSACTRSDTLFAGASYPAITITADIATNPNSQVANLVSVSGGGSPATSANDVATILAGSPPTITSLNPSSATSGGTGFTLTINGTTFVPGATAIWGNTPLTTTFVSASQLTAIVPASLIATAGTVSVAVTTSGGASAGMLFTIIPPPPTITSLSPSSAYAGGAAFILTVNGTNFVSGATVNWNSTALTTTFVSAGQLTAAVPASLIATAGTASVTVTTTGGTSAGATFTINRPPPTITSLNPSSATAGGAAFTLTINGTSFGSGAKVEWNTTALAKTYVSTTELTAAVPASLIATPGTASVTVTTAVGTSAGATFTINPPPPTITSLSPSSATAGGVAFTLTVNGTSFVSGATVQWGTTALTTTFVSATKLTAAVPASLIATAGTASVTVTTSGGTSAGATFTIKRPPPTITSLNPSTATAGGAAFTLTVNGTSFGSGAKVKWNGTALTTTYVSATELTAAVPASLITTVGTASVTVTTSTGTSAGSTFTINPPPPTIKSLSPSSATAGGAAFTLTVNGTNFVLGAKVKWNGTALTTTYVSGTKLTAAVPASLIATAGTASVTVTTAGGTSAGATFTINP